MQCYGLIKSSFKEKVTSTRHKMKRAPAFTESYSRSLAKANFQRPRSIRRGELFECCEMNCPSDIAAIRFNQKNSVQCFISFALLFSFSHAYTFLDTLWISIYTWKLERRVAKVCNVPQSCSVIVRASMLSLDSRICLSTCF
jgi:hypothetical protein